MEKSCWSCGHYLIGCGCWKDGQLHQNGWKDVKPDDSCSHWVAEGFKGSVTSCMEEPSNNSNNEVH